MLKVNIDDLTFKCIIGILDFEREKKQKVVLNISFEYFFQEDGSNFIDYSKVANFCERSMKKEKFELIEDAILFLRKGLKSTYDIKNLMVKISKPDIMPNCIVSVQE